MTFAEILQKASDLRASAEAFRDATVPAGLATPDPSEANAARVAIGTLRVIVAETLEPLAAAHDRLIAHETQLRTARLEARRAAS
jgi:hypothetical protein